jgi:polysaccharide export outer membrane protein
MSAATPDFLYQIGIGDTVNVVVWRNPEISGSYPVRPDGKFSTPLIDDLDAVGREPQTLAREIERALSKYVRDPIVTVIVSGFNGPVSQQIRILGEAARPSTMSYRQGMTLLDLMIQVGLTDFAGDSAYIMRTSEGGRKYAVRVRDLVRYGDMSANVDMKPGDILMIPQSWF